MDLLALIDTRFERSPEETTSFLAKATAYVGRTWSRPDKLYRDGVCRLILSLLVQHSPLRLLRRIDDLAQMMPSRTAAAFRIEIFTSLRARSIRRWDFKPLGVPTTLLRSDDAPPSRPDHGWGTLCSQLTVRPIPGGHRSLFEPQYRDALCAQFVRAVEDAAPNLGGSVASPQVVDNTRLSGPPHAVGLLGVRRERPRRRAAEKRDEITPPLGFPR